MNGSIVYELERPENSGLKKSLKACTQSHDFLAINTNLNLQMCICNYVWRYLFYISFFALAKFPFI